MLFTIIRLFDENNEKMLSKFSAYEIMHTWKIAMFLFNDDEHSVHIIYFLNISYFVYSNFCCVQRRACLHVTPNKVHRKPIAALQR